MLRGNQRGINIFYASSFACSWVPWYWVAKRSAFLRARSQTGPSLIKLRLQLVLLILCGCPCLESRSECTASGKKKLTAACQTFCYEGKGRRAVLLTRSRGASACLNVYLFKPLALWLLYFFNYYCWHLWVSQPDRGIVGQQWQYHATENQDSFSFVIPQCWNYLKNATSDIYCIIVSLFVNNIG